MEELLWVLLRVLFLVVLLPVVLLVRTPWVLFSAATRGGPYCQNVLSEYDFERVRWQEWVMSVSA